MAAFSPLKLGVDPQQFLKDKTAQTMNRQNPMNQQFGKTANVENSVPSFTGAQASTGA